jgi:short-subunit dehydrogenase
MAAIPREWRSVWIAGASTGIGRELALKLADAGAAVAVSARSADKLAALARSSPRIRAVPLDIADADATAAAVASIEAAQGPIDLAILNAGVWHPMGARDFDPAKGAQSMAVNYMGMVHALAPLLASMRARRSGHIAMTASVAGYRGLPRASAYAPTKAAIIALAETLYSELAHEGVKISVVNPGFVDTPMTAVNRFPMPFMVSSRDAADRILAGLTRGRFEVAFPWQMVALLKFARILPYPAYFWFERTFLAPRR